MKIQNKRKFITYTIAILSLILLVRGVVESFKYSKLYNSVTEEVIREYNDTHKMLWSTTLIEDNSIKSTLVLLSGIKLIGNIKIDSDTTINLKLSTKTGKVKVVLWDEKEEIVVSEKLLQDEEELSIKPDEYQIIIIGQWFTGEFILNTKGAEITDIN